jgi:hypothetical protein
VQARLADSYTELARMALGWLGWNEKDTMHSDVNTILVAFEGLCDRLKAEHGSTEEPQDVPPWVQRARARKAKEQGQPTVQGPRTATGQPARMLTPAAFDAMFGRPAGKPIVIKNPLRKGK